MKGPRGSFARAKVLDAGGIGAENAGMGTDANQPASKVELLRAIVGSVLALTVAAGLALSGCAAHRDEANLSSYDSCVAREKNGEAELAGVWWSQEDTTLLELGRNKAWKWSE